MGEEELAKLMRLRTNVGAYHLQDVGFIVSPQGYGGQSVGGPCKLDCKKLGNIFELIPSPGGSTDSYFFPYVSRDPTISTGRGVGWCDVPVDATGGTIVVTGGMNGCALEIREDNGFLRFIHDSGGTSIAPLPANHPAKAGRQAIRIAPDEYWRDSDMQNDMSAQHYFIAVKDPIEEEWAVLHTPVQSFKTQGNTNGYRFIPGRRTQIVKRFPERKQT